MSKLKENWETSSTYEKVAMIISTSLMAALIVLSAVGLFGILPSIFTNAVGMIILSAIIMMQGFVFLRQNKPLGVIAIVFAGITIVFDIISVIILLLK